MTSLPYSTRPSSPTRGRLDSRKFSDDRNWSSARAAESQTAFRPHSDRNHLPRSRVIDSYARPPGDSRRDHEERGRDRDRYHGLDRSREFRGRDTVGWRSPDPDKYHRSSVRERSPERRNRRYASRERYIRHGPRSPSPWRDRCRWSRSPPRRRHDSPPYRGRLTPHLRSRSPPLKRMRLGNHSIDFSPRRSTEPTSPHSANSTKPEQETSITPLVQSYPSSLHKERDESLIDQITSKNDTPLASRLQCNEEEMKISGYQIKSSKAGTASATLSVSPPDELPANRHPESQQKSDHKMHLDTSTDLPDRPALHREVKDSKLPSQPSRSPPRGPRSHARGNPAPTGPVHFRGSGPQAPRRPPPNAPSVARSIWTLAVSGPEAQEVDTLPDHDTNKVDLPEIPAWEGRPSITRELDCEVTMF